MLLSIAVWMSIAHAMYERSVAVGIGTTYLQEAMAFGDGGNDLPLIRDVAVGVAMGNACEELKAEADYITSSVDEDGVSRALEYFELI
jgi:hydroxymethylpyrimidine pyrophosphatase-like HAD family hydrolase